MRDHLMADLLAATDPKAAAATCPECITDAHRRVFSDLAEGTGRSHEELHKLMRESKSLLSFQVACNALAEARGRKLSW